MFGCIRGDAVGVLFKNSDITIYNRYYDNSLGADRYQRTVIKGVNWQGKKTVLYQTKDYYLLIVHLFL